MTICSIARRPRWLLALVLVGFASVGCDRSSRGLSLDQNQAREACAAFLTAWKEGKQPGDLRPKITGRDYSWDSGQKLVAFELLPDETNDGTNLHIPVRLTLQDPEGKESTSNATYTVGTSPVVTVFRK
jgi:hypothetical protein